MKRWLNGLLILITASCGLLNPLDDDNKKSAREEGKFKIYIAWMVPFSPMLNLHNHIGPSGAYETSYPNSGFFTADYPYETLEEFWFETASGHRYHVDETVLDFNYHSYTPVELDSGEYVRYGFKTSPICKRAYVFDTYGSITGTEEVISQSVEVTGNVYLVGQPSRAATVYDKPVDEHETVFELYVIIDAMCINTTFPTPNPQFEGTITIQKDFTYTTRISQLRHLNPL